MASVPPAKLRPLDLPRCEFGLFVPAASPAAIRRSMPPPAGAGVTRGIAVGPGHPLIARAEQRRGLGGLFLAHQGPAQKRARWPSPNAGASRPRGSPGPRGAAPRAKVQSPAASRDRPDSVRAAASVSRSVGFLRADGLLIQRCRRVAVAPQLPHPGQGEPDGDREPVVGAEPRTALLQDRPFGRLGSVELAAGQVEFGAGHPGSEGVGVAVALGLATRRDGLVEDRHRAVELPGIRQALAQAFETNDGVGVVGAELRLRQRQRLLVQRQRPVVLPALA